MCVGYVLCGSCMVCCVACYSSLLFLLFVPGSLYFLLLFYNCLAFLVYRFVFSVLLLCGLVAFCFVMFSKQVQDCVGVNLRTSGKTFCAILELLGCSPGSFWDQFGIIWDQLGIYLGVYLY